jgi:plastocyanin
MLSPTILLLAGTGLTAAVTIIPVSVGKSGLTFAPDMIRAQVGDVIEFRYWPLKHSVIAGDFSNACRPAASNGFFSGFFSTKAGTVNVLYTTLLLPTT